MPGHSFLPCDRDFALIEKKRKKCDRVLVPSYWVNLVREAQSKVPFTVVYVEHPLTDDLSPDGTAVVKVRDYKSALEKVIATTIQDQSKMKGVIFSREGTKGRMIMTGDCTTTLALLKKRRGVSSASLRVAVKNAGAAFSDFCPIKPAKVDDVKALLQCVALPENVTFYESLQGVGNDNEGEEEEEEDTVTR